MSDTHQPMIDQRTFRNTMGLFATGVAVIATLVPDDGEVHAMTANSVASLSLNPMLLLFCPSKQSSLAKYLPRMQAFSVNILREEQRALSTYFAGGWKQHSAPNFNFVAGEHSPYLEGSLASVQCSVHQIIDGGDHWLVIGRAVAIHQGNEPHLPLVFFKGRYRDVDNSASISAPNLSD